MFSKMKYHLTSRTASVSITDESCSTGDGNKYAGQSFWNHSCFLMSSMVALFIGSICNIWHSKLTTLDLLRYSGIGKIPDLIFLNKVGTCSSSKGRVPQRRAYRITPQDQISTSGPAYSFPDITYLKHIGKIKYNQLKC